MPHPLYAAVARRASGRCEYCRAPERLAGYAFEVEHITPFARGGTAIPDNLALACGACNKAKSVRQRAKDPATGELVPLFHPRREAWEAHFAWSEGHTVIIGYTAVGRATIAALRLNAQRRRDARVLWSVLAELGVGGPPFEWP